MVSIPASDPIRSRANPRFRHLRGLVDDGRERARQQRSVLVGAHLLRAWLDHGRPLISLAVDALAATASAELGPLLARAAGEGVPITAFSRDLMGALGGLDSAVEVVAEIAVPPGRREALRRQDVVALDGIQDPGNVGALLRTAAAAGVAHALFGPGCAQPWSPRVLRAAMGAHAVMNLVEVETLEVALRELGTRCVGASVRAPRWLHETALPRPCAWVFGSEGRGLSPAVAAALDLTVAIDQATGVESLNVAAAAAVCLFEQRRQRSERG
jgi:TrmH family RNA methyltransferase